jgi:hypothetical protein
VRSDFPFFCITNPTWIHRCDLCVANKDRSPGINWVPGELKFQPLNPTPLPHVVLRADTEPRLNRRKRRKRGGKSMPRYPYFILFRGPSFIWCRSRPGQLRIGSVSGYLDQCWFRTVSVPGFFLQISYLAVGAGSGSWTESIATFCSSLRYYFLCVNCYIEHNKILICNLILINCSAFEGSF